jgi:hypothetical protein
MDMKPYYYKLDADHNPVPCDLEDFAKQFSAQSQMRQVAFDEIRGVRISTAFLGIDHNYGDGPPILFETMIFGGDHDGYQDRYYTWNEAIEGHKKAIELIFEV